jgi:hypothetical protein
VDPFAANTVAHIPGLASTATQEEKLAATWVVIHPCAIEEYLKWARNKGCLSRVMSKSQMLAMARYINQKFREKANGRDVVFIIKQHHGEVVKIPIGWAHAVINERDNYKVARDAVVEGYFHQAYASYKCVWMPLVREKKDSATEFTLFMERAVELMLRPNIGDRAYPDPPVTIP